LAEIYVSTSLDTWAPSQPDLLARDVVLDGICFRRLDPKYYAWLRHKYYLAEKALDTGKITYEGFGKLLTRFNDIHILAVDRFGRETLQAAMDSLDCRAYAPPGASVFHPAPAKPEPTGPAQSVPVPSPAEPYLYPANGSWNFTQKIDPSAIEKVDAIREQALSLGWKEARLYQNRGRFPFPFGDDYGLACFINEGMRIGEVTAQYIEIIGPPPRESRQRFSNPDVEQPWMKKK